MTMLKIGLTGGIGSGKTTVSDLFKQQNTSSTEAVTILDTDIIARHIVEKGKPAYTKIVSVFGNKILNEDASINRSQLRNIIFKSPDLKKQLEEITHPAIQSEVEAALSQISSKYCIIVIPLLFETNSNYPLDRILVIDCDKTTQIKRAAIRDHVSETEIEKIIDTQVSREYRLNHADDVIYNDDNPEKLISQVENLHNNYINVAKSYK